MDVQKTMESMINQDGATLLFPTSFGYFDPHILQGGREVPEGAFPHCGGSGPRASTRRTSAATSATSTRPVPERHRRRPREQDQEARLHRGQADPAGAAQHQRVHARRAQRRPEDHHHVMFTGDWSLPVKEAEAANSLIDQGVDVLTCHVDSPKVDRADRREARHLRLRLPHEPGDARAQGLPHRRRVELGQGLHRRTSRTRRRASR